MIFSPQVSTTGGTVVETQSWILAEEGSILRRNERSVKGTTPWWSNHFVRGSILPCGNTPSGSKPPSWVAIVQIDAPEPAMIVCPWFAQILEAHPLRFRTTKFKKVKGSKLHMHIQLFLGGASGFESPFAHRHSPQCVCQQFESPRCM